MARKIEVQLVGDSRSLERAFSRSQGAGSKLGNTIGRGLKVAAGIGAVGLAGLGVAAKIGFDEFSEGQRVAAQTNAVIKSTGGVAKVSAKQVEDLAESLMKKSGVDDEAIKSGENLLLTFTKIRNEVGKGNDIFNQATKAALDMSVAMGTDMRTAALQVGKALNDPVRGMTALRRVGVSFTEKQEDLIKKLVESGDQLGAQKVILRELRKEFGKSAEAAGNTFAGQVDILRERFNNWAGDMVGKVMPTLTRVFDDIGKFFDRIGRAKGFTAKLKVTWLGVSGVVSDLFDKIHEELVGGREALKLPGGQILEWTETQGLLDKLREALEGADWAAIGQTIGENISSKVRITAEFLGRMLEAMNSFIDSHLDEIASIGAKILAAIFVKLTDPAFWAKNWKLALGVAVAVFPLGKVFKLGGIVGRFLGGGLIGAFLRQMARLPIIVQEALRLVRILFKSATDWIGTQVGKIPGWIRAAMRLTAVIAFVNGVKRLFNEVRQKVADVWNWIQDKIDSLNGSAAVAAMQPFLNMINTIISAVKTLIDWISRIDFPSPPGWLSRAGSFVGGVVNPDPRNALGGTVMQSGRAIVHAGETIVPARVARGGSGGGSGGPGRWMILADDQTVRYLQGLNGRHMRGNGGRAIW